MRHVLVTISLGADDRARLRRATDADLRFVAVPEADDIAWADVAFGGVPPDLLLAAVEPPAWVHVPSVGLDPYAAVLRDRPEIAVTNAQGVMDHAVAEHAIALLLAMTRSLPLLLAAQRAGAWDRATYVADERVTVLAGRSAHVLGFGSIAQTLIGKLHALGMRVTAYRRQGGGAHHDVERFLPFDALVSEIHEADVVVGILPSRPETVGLLSRACLDRLKDDAFVVNVGRGSLMDEPALVDRLRGRGLGGVALDVFAEEPLAADSPLWSMPNVIVSPHVAGRFDREVAEHVRAFIERYQERFA